jgi:hypothetical protein
MFTSLRADSSLIIPNMALLIDFNVLVTRHVAIQVTGF